MTQHNLRSCVLRNTDNVATRKQLSHVSSACGNACTIRGQPYRGAAPQHVAMNARLGDSPIAAPHTERGAQPQVHSQGRCDAPGQEA